MVNLSLYSDNHPNKSLKNSGYKDEKIAKKTLELIIHRSIIYQKAVVNTMLNRALYHKNRTNEMEDAIKIYQNWIKKNKNKKIKYKYLPLSLIKSFEKLADEYNISHVSRGIKPSTKSEYGFLVMYKKVAGKYIKLPFVTTNKTKKYDYDVLREKFINAKLAQMKKQKSSFFYKSGKYKNLPTKQHLVLIMNGYSPYPIKLKKLIY